MKASVFFFIIFCLFLITCRDPEIEKKIDPGLKRQLLQLKQNSQLDKPVSIVFRVNEEFTPLHSETLTNRGLRIVGHIGNIYTGTIQAKSVYEIARFRFVDYVQGSQKIQTHSADTTATQQ
jgi:hypothetical protein